MPERVFIITAEKFNFPQLFLISKSHRHADEKQFYLCIFFLKNLWSPRFHTFVNIDESLSRIYFYDYLNFVIILHFKYKHSIRYKWKASNHGAVMLLFSCKKDHCWAKNKKGSGKDNLHSTRQLRDKDKNKNCWNTFLINVHYYN